MKFSTTIIGILIMVAGTLLVQWGFTEACAGEITEKLTSLIPLLGGGGLAWYGRYKAGGITAFGAKK